MTTAELEARGYAPATDKQIIGGSAPFVINHLKGDSAVCATHKAGYNQVMADQFAQPSRRDGSNALTGVVQSLTIPAREKAIVEECKPLLYHQPKSTPARITSLGAPPPVRVSFPVARPPFIAPPPRPTQSISAQLPRFSMPIRARF